MREESHTVLGNNSLRCLNCGQEMALLMPMSITMISAMAKAWDKDHKRCKPSAAGRARFAYTSPEQWFHSWDTGASSLSIFRFFTDRPPVFSYKVPADADDFGRCYRLLKVAPEWRARFVEMTDIKIWSPFVLAWPRLEQLFEQGQWELLYRALQQLEEESRG